MSYVLFAIPVSRAVSSASDFDVPGVVRTVTGEEARAALLPVLPEGYPWPTGTNWINWRASDGSRLEVSVGSDGRCVFLRGVGTSGETWLAVKRIAALTGWSVFDPQTFEFVLPD